MDEASLPASWIGLPPPTSPDESFVAADRVYREAGYQPGLLGAAARRARGANGEPRNWLFAALIGRVSYWSASMRCR